MYFSRLGPNATVPRCLFACARFSSVSSSKRNKYMERKMKNMAYANKAATPEFSQLLRNFYKLSHPDIIRSSYPQYADINDQSLQLLNGVLSTVKSKDEYPAKIIQTIPFYVRSKDGSECKRVELTIRTAGGDCRHSFASSFRTLFKEAGVSEDGIFVWGKDYFPTEEAA